MAVSESPRAPDDTFVRQRWIPRRRRQWALDCDQILTEYGAVEGSIRYPKRHLARYRAQSLIRLMVELRLHERWELGEHTDEMPDGSWTWTVELRRNP